VECASLHAESVSGQNVCIDHPRNRRQRAAACKWIQSEFWARLNITGVSIRQQGHATIQLSARRYGENAWTERATRPFSVPCPAHGSENGNAVLLRVASFDYLAVSSHLRVPLHSLLMPTGVVGHLTFLRRWSLRAEVVHVAQ
jgi:hypothetical protein